MSRTKKFFYNSFSSVIMQVTTLIAGLIVPRLMLTTYGSEINGLISSIGQFINYFSLVEVGLAGASIYALYKPLAEGDHDGINSVVSASKNLYMQSGLVFCALVFGLSLSYPIFIKPKDLTPLQVGILVLVLSAPVGANFFALAKYRVLLTADQKVYIINYLLSLSIVVNTIIVMILTSVGYDILLLRVVSLISVIIPPSILYFYATKNYKYLKFNSPPNYGALNKRWDALILQFLGLIHTAAPIVLATLFTSLEMVSVYAIFNMVIMGVNGIASIFGSGLSASFGEILAKHEQKAFAKAYNEYELMTYVIVAFLYSCCIVLIMPFINIYTADITDANYNQPIIGFLIVLNAILYSIKNPQGTLVSSAGLFKETRNQTLIQAGIALGLGAILAKPIGLIGILIGLIVSNIYRDIDLLIFIPKQLSTIEIRTSFLRALRILIQVLIVSMPFNFVKLNIYSYLDWFSLAGIVAVYALFVITLTTILTDRKTLLSIFGRFRLMMARG